MFKDMLVFLVYTFVRMFRPENLKAEPENAPALLIRWWIEARGVSYNIEAFRKDLRLNSLWSRSNRLTASKKILLRDFTADYKALRQLCNPHDLTNTVLDCPATHMSKEWSNGTLCAWLAVKSLRQKFVERIKALQTKRIESQQRLGVPQTPTQEETDLKRRAENFIRIMTRFRLVTVVKQKGKPSQIATILFNETGPGGVSWTS